ncbi:Por secretion system C-terminal sorting domain-containing protein [Dyadobacter soli]|uniref:Por secretion system C-terminal sorting domain-containing protein n=1 Tax=Dyadobacter soli TaxID=659014 RepID=A0A1G7VD48_9BACT|nr:ubiquitin-like protein [Dyadobacter soli]SDG57488.1 Por secretion system C-terminal sorting domain-containing protein [Dyadobacter soli]
MKRLLQNTSIRLESLVSCRGLLAAMLLCVQLAAQPKVLAQVITPSGSNILYVNRDVNTGAAGYTGSGDSWANAIPQLADALHWARQAYQAGGHGWSSANPLRILVAKGVYLPRYQADDRHYTTDGGRYNSFVMVRDVQLYGGFDPAAGIDDLGDARILPNKAAPGQGTVLSGDFLGNDNQTDFVGHAENAHHVVISGGNAGVARLDGFVVSGGRTNDESTGMIPVNGQMVQHGTGAGFYISNSSPSIVNCLFYRNTATTQGGGGCIFGSGSEPTLSQCTFYKNASESGGGLYCYGTTAIFSACVFEENSAGNGGGGVYNWASNTSFTDCQFTRNSADGGGGLGNLLGSPVITNGLFAENSAQNGGGIGNGEGTITLQGSTLTGNSATADGGGVHNIQGNMTANDCVFESNEAGSRGGAMRNDRATVIIRRSRIANNTAGQGGAIINEACNSVNIFNSSLTGNNALMGGGMMSGLCTLVRMTNCTVWGNVTGAYGGGALTNVNSPFTLANSIVWNNESNGVSVSTEASLSTMSGELPKIKNSLIANWGGSTAWNAALGVDGGNNIDNDPDFVSTTPGNANFLRLANPSPARNTGSNSAYTDVGGNLSTDKDLAANPRVVGSAIDMGALENQSAHAGIQVLVTSWTGETFSVDVFLSDAVMQLKQKIEDLKGIPVAEQRLRFNGESLVDGMTLGDYAIQDQSALQLVRVAEILYVDAVNGNDENDGVSWASASQSVSHALAIANAEPLVSTIRVAKGVYYPTGVANGTDRTSTFHIARGGIRLFGGYDAVTGERNLTTNITKLSGSIGDPGIATDNSYHVMVIANMPADADSIVVDGFVISDGYANGGGTAAFNGVSVSQNYGGGIFSKRNLNGQKLRFANLIIQKNFGAFAAGMLNEEQSSPLIVNCQITGNAAGGNGGGMLNRNASSPQIINCTIAGNKANDGGGIFNYIDAAPVIHNTILYGNSSAMNSYAGSIPSVSYSLVQGGAEGTGNLNLNPLFANAVSHTLAPTGDGDYRLESCSPAINSASNALLPDQLTTRDLAGSLRKVHQIVDMGAWEFQSSLQTAAQSLAQHGDQGTAAVAGRTDLMVSNDACRIVIRLLPTGSSPVSGNVSASVYVDADVAHFRGSPYVQRRYVVTAPAGGSALLTLFFTQEEFDRFNHALPAGPLPSGPDDAVNKGNLRVFKFSGFDGSQPDDFPGAPEAITPAPENIQWNTVHERWEITFNVDGFSSFLIGSAASPLPVKLVSFVGMANDDQSVQLDWRVTEQQNIETYKIQYSTNGRDFQPAGSVPATDMLQSNYTFRHTPSPGAAVLYYRLLIEERDGARSFSRMVSVGLQGPGQVIVYPNPAVAAVRVKRPGATGTTGRLLDQSGRKVRAWVFKSDEHWVDVSALPAGLYLMLFSDGITEKFIKQ